MIQEGHIVCGECDNVGVLDTSIKLIGSTETCKGYLPFYENEMWHTHNGNIEIGTFMCRNGHEWKEQIRHKCECGWIQ